MCGIRDSSGKFIKGHKSIVVRRSKYIIVNCNNCNKQFEITEYKFINNKGKYCSKECSNNSKFGSNEIRKCLVCNKEFVVKAYKKNIKTKGKFCSKECCYKGRSPLPQAFKKGEINGPKKNPKSQETIEKLRIAQRKVNRRGEASPLWKGGCKTERRKDMGSWEYKEWRRLVFERDKFTCKFCNDNKLYLHADHIKSYADYPELRYNVDNGETLCYRCHYKRTFPNIFFNEENALRWGTPKKYRSIYKISTF